MLMIHQFNPDMPPDSEFLPGRLEHLVPGNTGRMLDARRTPVRLAGLRLAAGFLEVEVLDFEDRGARWELPLESVNSFQFARDSIEADPDMVALYRAVIAKLDVPLKIHTDPAARQAAEARIGAIRTGMSDWLAAESQFFRPGLTLDFTLRTGPEALQRDLQHYMKSHGLWDIEDSFASRWVSNPYAGEMVKAHSIVLARLGLVPFDGKQLRDPDRLSGTMDESRRADHILHRLAFVREAFERLGHGTLILYRGTAFRGCRRRREKGSFVSATFSLEVAMSMFDDRDGTSTGLLIRQPVPCTRLFMSYLETEQMNRQYSEAEAVLLNDSTRSLF